MKYTVAELDAMPVGTVLMNRLAQCIKTRDKVYKWMRIENLGMVGHKQHRGYTVSSRALTTCNFTHRADPQPIGDNDA